MRQREPTIAPPVIEHVPEYVRGYPMHMALIITPLPAVGDELLPDVSLHYVVDVEATFTHANGAVITAGHRRARRLGRPPTGPFLEPVPGEPQRALFDAQLLDALDRETGELSDRLPLGSYTVEIRYMGLPAPPFTMTLRDPTVAEKHALDQIETERTRDWQPGRRWPDWFMSGKSPSAPPTITKRDPLRYLRVLRYLMRSPTPPQAVDPRLLDVLDGFYAPEAELLRADLAMGRGDRAEFDRRAAIIRSSYPGLAAELRGIEEHGSSIVRDRNALSP